ncbi:hypothetical protein [Comamonas sp. JC664]|uniref:hypothetical protein n=1 Tax=Comamonas sp. JC664 TaxID=2801917 RepID=UPI00174A1821|nr:hypothetical protein [Comamonas sp. JC664]MBL0693803.1 hypothetical protein [Comamonas sp. JC664]GHG74497.1 hypothetical protein GCM10012319_22320 [Comamonas sp. KCTC 72670]
MRTPLHDTWTRRIAAFLVVGLVFTACGDDPPQPAPDGGTGLDAGTDDAGIPDAGLDDAGTPDAGEPEPDAGASCEPASVTAILENGEWDPRFSIAGVSGMDGHAPHVYDVTKLPSGDLVATGYFRWLGAQSSTPIIRRHQGQWESVPGTWTQAIPGGSGFSAVAAKDDTTLALATNDTFGERSGEVWLMTPEGVQVLGSFTGLVRTMAYVQDELWVAGQFEFAEIGAVGLAIWDGTAWKLPPGGPANGFVYELLVSGDDVWVGGAFSQVGGIASNKVARWDGTTWHPYDFPIPGNGVFALTLGDDGTPYAGGTFAYDFNQDGVGSIARWNGTRWEMLDEGVSTGFYPGVVTDLVFHEGKLHVGGCFNFVNGQGYGNPLAIEANALAVWSPDSGWAQWPQATSLNRTVWHSRLFCGDEPPEVFPLWDVPIQRFLLDDDRIYVTGSLPSIDGAASQSIVSYADGHWRAEGAEPGDGLSGGTRTLAVGGEQCAVHALGNMTHAGGTRVPSTVLRFTDSGWQALGAFPAMECRDLAVNAHGDIFVMCVDWDVFQSHVLTWNGEDWESLGDLREHGFASTMALDALGRPWLATQAEAASRVIRWTGEQFEVVADGIDGPVYALALRPENDDPDRPAFVVTGEFMHVGELPARRIAHWTGSAFEALGEGLSTSPITAAYGAHGIYASTNEETTLDGSPVPGRLALGHWNGTAWRELATPDNGMPSPMHEGGVHSFRKLMPVGNDLVVVGTLIPEDGAPTHAYVFHGERFVAVGGGINALSAEAIALTPDGIWLGGDIAEAGRGESLIPSVGVAHFRRRIEAP